MKNARWILSSRLLSLVCFATTGLVHAQPTPPTVSTFPASAVGATNATLNGTANPDGVALSGWFQWGTTTNYGNVTAVQMLGNGIVNTNFRQVVGGLFVGVTHHYRAVASNSFHVVYGTNQSFTTPAFANIEAGLPGVSRSAVAWGDYDNDGRLDFILTGATNVNASGVVLGAISQIWRNTGTGFSNVTSLVASGLPGVAYGSLAWGDYDNDGWLDFLLTGYAGGLGSISQIWRNNGGTFTNVTSTLAPGLPGVGTGTAAWGDYDHDGRLDFLLTGEQSGSYRSQIWRNTGSNFVNAMVPGLPGIIYSSVAWVDYDDDGWLDFFLTGATNFNNTTGTYLGTARLNRNISGSFADVTGAQFPGLSPRFLGSTAWSDSDQDGRPDLLITGYANGLVRGAQVWRNTVTGFINANAGLPAISESAAAWGDYDNDGRPDILLAGYTGTTNLSQLWRNTGAGFTNINLVLPGASLCSVTWADYDNDGRLDFLLAGNTANNGQSNFITQVWRNHTSVTNTPPSAPTGLAAAVNGGVATLNWNAATDGQTLAAGLNYNIRIGTTPGGVDVIAPAAASGGFRRVPLRGNAEQGLTALLKYQPGTPYYWSVQAVDSAFAGSAFSAEGSFRIFDPSPLVTPVTTTSLVPGDINGDGLVDQSELNAVLSNYFPSSPWLYLTNVAGLGGTNVTFALSNSTAGAFSVEYTTNLFDWLFLGPATPRYLFTDTNAPAVPQRYYRLRWP